MTQLSRIQVAGFKSIRDQDIELGSLNVLIGANGAGKSNLIQVFKLINRLVAEELKLHVTEEGGASRLLHFGPKVTERLHLHLHFGRNQYRCSLVPTADDSLAFADETVFFHGPGYPDPYEQFLGNGQKETNLHGSSQATPRMTNADHVLTASRGWQIYHFHDTSPSSRIKQIGNLSDNKRLRTDAGNLAAFLYGLKETQPESYRKIVEVVRMAAPFFREFDLGPDRLKPDQIKLEWQEAGSDTYFDGHSLSDGSLRFMCLATLLLQPELPTTVLLDEPELGLHPYAITLLADLLRSAATRTQVVVSTQSVTLVNQLSPEDILVVDRAEGASEFRRLQEAEIAEWMADYGLGEIWEKNLVGGRPAT